MSKIRGPHKNQYLRTSPYFSYTLGSLIFGIACFAKHVNIINSPAASRRKTNLKSSLPMFLSVTFLSLGVFFTISNARAECVIGDCENGQGTYIWANGEQYAGEWKNGKPDGKGSFFWPEGDSYVGEWNNEKDDDTGSYFCPTGSTLYFLDATNNVVDGHGCLLGDCEDGYGIYVWVSGAKYVGLFEGGEKNGLGAYSFPNGKKIEGMWKNDKYIGRKNIRLSSWEG